MRRSAGSTLFLCCLTACMQAVHAVELRDDRGTLVRLPAPAVRIVTLAPHLAEVVFSAGAGERLTGVVQFSDFPAAVQRLPRVGDAARVDLERILLLKPDLVLAWKSGNQAGDIARLEKLGLRVFVTEPLRLSDVARLLRAVGALAGTDNAAQEAAAAFERDIAALRTQFGRRPPLRVFYEIWHRPLLTVNGDHMISDVINVCGGINVFADAPLLTPAVSLEAVLAARPDAIVGGGSAVAEREFLAQWRGYGVEELKRVAIVYVAPDGIQRATPRVTEGARAICEALERVRTSRR